MCLLLHKQMPVLCNHSMENKQSHLFHHSVKRK